MTSFRLDDEDAAFLPDDFHLRSGNGVELMDDDDALFLPDDFGDCNQGYDDSFLPKQDASFDVVPANFHDILLDKNKVIDLLRSEKSRMELDYMQIKEDYLRLQEDIKERDSDVVDENEPEDEPTCNKMSDLKKKRKIKDRRSNGRVDMFSPDMKSLGEVTELKNRLEVLENKLEEQSREKNRAFDDLKKTTILMRSDLKKLEDNPTSADECMARQEHSICSMLGGDDELESSTNLHCIIEEFRVLLKSSVNTASSAIQKGNEEILQLREQIVSLTWNLQKCEEENHGFLESKNNELSQLKLYLDEECESHALAISRIKEESAIKLDATETSYKKIAEQLRNELEGEKKKHPTEMVETNHSTDASAERGAGELFFDAIDEAHKFSLEVAQASQLALGSCETSEVHHLRHELSLLTKDLEECQDQKYDMYERHQADMARMRQETNTMQLRFQDEMNALLRQHDHIVNEIQTEYQTAIDRLNFENETAVVEIASMVEKLQALNEENEFLATEANTLAISNSSFVEMQMKYDALKVSLDDRKANEEKLNEDIVNLRHELFLRSSDLQEVTLKHDNIKMRMQEELKLFELKLYAEQQEHELKFDKLKNQCNIMMAVKDIAIQAKEKECREMSEHLRVLTAKNKNLQECNSLLELGAEDISAQLKKSLEEKSGLEHRLRLTSNDLQNSHLLNYDLIKEHNNEKMKWKESLRQQELHLFAEKQANEFKKNILKEFEVLVSVKDSELSKLMSKVQVLENEMEFLGIELGDSRKSFAEIKDEYVAAEIKIEHLEGLLASSKEELLRQAHKSNLQSNDLEQCLLQKHDMMQHHANAKKDWQENLRQLELQLYATRQESDRILTQVEKKHKIIMADKDKIHLEKLEEVQKLSEAIDTTGGKLAEIQAQLDCALTDYTTLKHEFISMEYLYRDATNELHIMEHRFLVTSRDLEESQLQKYDMILQHNNERKELTERLRQLELQLFFVQKESIWNLEQADVKRPNCIPLDSLATHAPNDALENVRDLTAANEVAVEESTQILPDYVGLLADHDFAASEEIEKLKRIVKLVSEKLSCCQTKSDLLSIDLENSHLQHYNLVQQHCNEQRNLKEDLRLLELQLTLERFENDRNLLQVESQNTYVISAASEAAPKSEKSCLKLVEQPFPFKPLKDTANVKLAVVRNEFESSREENVVAKENEFSTSTEADKIVRLELLLDIAWKDLESSQLQKYDLMQMHKIQAMQWNETSHKLEMQLLAEQNNTENKLQLLEIQFQTIMDDKEHSFRERCLLYTEEVKKLATANQVIVAELADLGHRFALLTAIHDRVGDEGETFRQLAGYRAEKISQLEQQLFLSSRDLEECQLQKYDLIMKHNEDTVCLEEELRQLELHRYADQQESYRMIAELETKLTTSISYEDSKGRDAESTHTKLMKELVSLTEEKRVRDLNFEIMNAKLSSLEVEQSTSMAKIESLGLIIAQRSEEFTQLEQLFSLKSNDLEKCQLQKYDLIQHHIKDRRLWEEDLRQLNLLLVAERDEMDRCNDKLRKELQVLRSENDFVTSEKQQLRETIDELTSVKGFLEERLEELRSLLAVANDEQDKLYCESESLKRFSEEKSDRIRELEQAFALKLNELEGSEIEKNGLNQQYQHEISKLTGALTTLEHQLKSMTNNSISNVAHAATQTDAENLSSIDHDEFRQHLLEHEAELDQLRTAKRELQERLNKSAKSETESLELIRHLREKYEQMSSKLQNAIEKERSDNREHAIALNMAIQTVEELESENAQLSRDAEMKQKEALEESSEANQREYEVRQQLTTALQLVEAKEQEVASLTADYNNKLSELRTALDAEDAVGDERDATIARLKETTSNMEIELEILRANMIALYREKEDFRKQNDYTIEDKNKNGSNNEGCKQLRRMSTHPNSATEFSGVEVNEYDVEQCGTKENAIHEISPSQLLGKSDEIARPTKRQPLYALSDASNSRISIPDRQSHADIHESRGKETPVGKVCKIVSSQSSMKKGVASSRLSSSLPTPGRRPSLALPPSIRRTLDPTRSSESASGSRKLVHGNIGEVSNHGRTIVPHRRSSGRENISGSTPVSKPIATHGDLRLTGIKQSSRDEKYHSLDAKAATLSRRSAIPRSTKTIQ